MPVVIPFDKLNGLDPELVEESGTGCEGQGDIGFVSTFRQAQGTAGSTNLGTRRLFELAVP